MHVRAQAVLDPAGRAVVKAASTLRPCSDESRQGLAEGWEEAETAVEAPLGLGRCYKETMTAGEVETAMLRFEVEGLPPRKRSHVTSPYQH